MASHIILFNFSLSFLFQLSSVMWYALIKSSTPYDQLRGRVYILCLGSELIILPDKLNVLGNRPTITRCISSAPVQYSWFPVIDTTEGFLLIILEMSVSPPP